MNNGAVLSELTSEAALRARPGSCVAIEFFWMHRLFQRIQAADPGDPAAGALSAVRDHRSVCRGGVPVVLQASMGLVEPPSLHLS